MTRRRTRAALPAGALSALAVLACLAAPEAGAATLTSSASDTVAGTPAAPKAITAQATFNVSPPFPGVGFKVTGGTLTLPEGLRLGTDPGAPSCGSAQVLADNTLCPAGSQVGAGSNDVLISGIPTTVTLTAYNAPGGLSLNVLAQVGMGKSVVVGTLDGAQRVLTMAWSPTPAQRITAATFTFTASGGWIHSEGCPAGSWTVEEAYNGDDASSVSATTSIPCSPAPTAPGAPGTPTATAGDAAATVSWTAAGDGGSPVTGYTVTAAPGGRTCTTAGDLRCTVTGLANGTSYTFTVAATNAVGQGPASAPSAAVTPRAPESPKPKIVVPATTARPVAAAPNGDVTVPATVSCPWEASGPCRVSVTVLSVTRVRAARSRGTVAKIPPGDSLRPSVRLDRKDLRRLRGRQRLRVTVRISVQTPDGVTTSRVVKIIVRRR